MLLFPINDKLLEDTYDNYWKWKKIYVANRNAILDPNIIFPKQRIVIPAQNPPVQ